MSPSASEMESWTLVLLVRPERAPELPESGLQEIQRDHLAHLGRLSESGALLAAGPVSDQEDERLRGMCLFSVGLEESKALMASDPAVVAGRLAVQVMRWWTMKDAVSFPLAGGSERA